MARRRCATFVALPLILLALGAPQSSAQLDPLGCLDCSVTLDTVDWNGTALPNQFASGTFRLTNSGQFTDSYTVTVTADNDTWTAEADPTTFADVPAGAGPLAADDNTRDFTVRVLVPEGTAAAATASIQVTVQSDSTADANATNPVIATAGQTYAWTLTCTEALIVEKTERDFINLTATNTGNGPDRATIIPVTPPQGIVLGDPDNVQTPARGSGTQTVEVGVGLAAADDDYDLRFDLRSLGDSAATASCTTVLTATGGTPNDDNGGGGNENGDSPGPAPLILVAVLALAAALTRRNT